jgi:hypothetical protein
MKLIAHRGLVNGPHKQFENQPHIVKTALEAGFDCEIDLWVVGDQRIMDTCQKPKHATLVN